MKWYKDHRLQFQMVGIRGLLLKDYTQCYEKKLMKFILVRSMCLKKHTRLNILLHLITARPFSILYNIHNQWRDRDNNQKLVGCVLKIFYRLLTVVPLNMYRKNGGPKWILVGPNAEIGYKMANGWLLFLALHNWDLIHLCSKASHHRSRIILETLKLHW